LTVQLTLNRSVPFTLELAGDPASRLRAEFWDIYGREKIGIAAPALA
jgi:hypothetical protein